ncbi:retroviral-like aspartic protease family protein [Acidobacteria bacterium AH-259-G07]|nr:retroviral-like aspartic protease family protein [Acidobacteria bacterium AH-259-G07]
MRGCKQWILNGLILVASSGIGFSANAPATMVPFRLHEHLIVVQGSIGDLHELSFAIDTGSSFTIVNTKVGQKLGLKSRETVEVSAWGTRVKMKKVVLPELRMGALYFQSIPARLAKLPRVGGGRVDALIGLDLLKKTNFTIDFTSKQITFGPTEDLKDSITFYPNFPFLAVKIFVEGRPVWLQLDTGASGVVLFRDKVKDKLPMRRSKDLGVFLAPAGIGRRQKVYLRSVLMGQTRWEELPAYLLDQQGSTFNERIVGNLGIATLDLKRIQFDFDNHRISWER